jgi:hypothetical protein
VGILPVNYPKLAAKNGMQRGSAQIIGRSFDRHFKCSSMVAAELVALRGRERTTFLATFQAVYWLLCTFDVLFQLVRLLNRA